MYIVFIPETKLSSCVLGRAYVTKNPLFSIKHLKCINFYIYETENECPIGDFFAKVCNNKIFFKDKTFGIKSTGSDTLNLIVFEPDGNYLSLGTGWSKSFKKEDLYTADCKDDGFICTSPEKAMDDWCMSVITDSQLDCGVEIPITKLI